MREVGMGKEGRRKCSGAEAQGRPRSLVSGGTTGRLLSGRSVSGGDSGRSQGLWRSS